MGGWEWHGKGGENGGEAGHGTGEGGLRRWKLSAQIINDTKQEIQSSG